MCQKNLDRLYELTGIRITERSTRGNIEGVLKILTADGKFKDKEHSKNSTQRLIRDLWVLSGSSAKEFGCAIMVALDNAEHPGFAYVRRVLERGNYKCEDGERQQQVSMSPGVLLDPKVKAQLDSTTKAFWLDLAFLMSECNGKLEINGEPPSIRKLSELLGKSRNLTKRCMNQLHDAGLLPKVGVLSAGATGGSPQEQIALGESHPGSPQEQSNVANKGLTDEKTLTMTDYDMTGGEKPEKGGGNTFTVDDLINDWNAMRGEMRHEISTGHLPVTRAKLQSLVDYWKVRASNEGITARDLWQRFVKYLSLTTYPEHYSQVHPLKFAEDLGEIDHATAGKYARSWKGKLPPMWMRIVSDYREKDWLGKDLLPME